MRIAIIGGGFSGLATCWHLLQSKNEVFIFDPQGIGGGASGIAAGLLHPYGGAHAKLNRWGHEGMQATKELLVISEKALGRSVASYTGVLRIATTKEQEDDYLLCASKFPEIQWCAQSKELVPQIQSGEGIFIPEGITVHSELYLAGLWKACESLGAIFDKQAVSSLEDLKDFDITIAAAGASIKRFPELEHLPINVVKGQILQMAWPKNLEPLPLSVNSFGYIAMHHDNQSCFIGSTYERDFTTTEPNIEVARQDIFPKIEMLLPELKDCAIINCRAGLRVSTPDHLPICKQVLPHCWVITGMGSKGLLYHALMAKKLTEQIH